MSIFDGTSPVHEPIPKFIIQLVIIMVLCRLLAYIFKFVKQPPVIAEVVAGILLGPSFLSHYKGFRDNIFPVAPDPSFTVLNVFANIGLIAFMFLVGLELDPQLLKRNARNSVIISVSAMVAPFALGVAAAVLVYHTLIPDTVEFSSFLLFVAVALSITAFPVLARILAETHMLDDRVGNIALSAAAVDDVVAWCLLALVVSIARASENKGSKQINALYTFLTLVGFILFMLFGFRKVLVKIAARARRHRNMNIHVIAFMLIVTYIFAWFTEVIGVHAIFGAFITGIVTPRENRFAVNITERIEDFVVIVLLPLYFTFSGLRTDLQSLNSPTAWGLTILVIICATVGKVGGATLAARFTGSPWRDSVTVGILMNTKGLVELIVLNLGLDVGVLTIEVFTMFVVMALVTTFVTTPLVHFIYLRYRDTHNVPKENYKLVLFVPDQKTGMVTPPAAEGEVSESNVKAVFMNEITDRPSSYFFQLSSKLNDNVPFFKDKSTKDMLHVVKKFGSSIGVFVSTKNLNSPDMFEAVKRTAANYSCELYLFGLNMYVEKEDAALQRTATPLLGFADAARRGVGSLMEFGIDKVVGNDSPVGNIIHRAITNINAPLGVFFTKSHAVQEIKTVAFLFHGHDHENLAWDQVLKFHPLIVVTIFTTTEAAPFVNLDYDKEQLPNMAILPSANPAAALLAANQHTVADLIVLGGKRNENDENVAKIVHEANSNILVVYPTPGTKPFERRSRGHSYGSSSSSTTEQPSQPEAQV